MNRLLNNIAVIFFCALTTIMNGAQPPDEGWVEVEKKEALSNGKSTIVEISAASKSDEAIHIDQEPLRTRISSIDSMDIFTAACMGNKDRVCQLIKEDPTVVNQAQYGWTPLHSAVLGGQLEIVRLLISAKADLNKQYTFDDTHVPEPRIGIEYNSDKGATPLFIASQMGYADIAIELIKAGADIEKSDERNRTPLFAATEKSHFAAVKELLAIGANPNAETVLGETPLSCTARAGNAALIQLLIDSKANVNLQNRIGETALLLAVLANSNEIVRNSIGEVEPFEANYADAVKKLIVAGANVDLQSYSERTPLLEAAHQNNTYFMLALIAAKANVNICKYLTPLHYVAHTGNIEAVKALLAAGADPNQEGDFQHIAPLDMVVGVGDEHILNQLHGAKRIAQLKVTKNHVTVAQLLIAAGAKLERTGRLAKYPLCFATSPIWDKLINGYKKQIAFARQQAKNNAKAILHTLALGLHQRLGKESPLRHISQDVLQHNLAPLVVTVLEDQAEFAARQPRTANEQSCVIS